MRGAVGRGREQWRVPRSRRPLVGAHEAIALTLTTVVFDFDGTLLDSDEALIAPFLVLGVPREDVRFGPLAVDECARLGVSLEDYVAGYDVNAAPPYDGVVALLDELVARRVRWSVCSNKIGRYASAELARLGWKPEVALFAEDFGGPKSVGPVLDAMGVPASEVVFVGDTAHDRDCARDAGVRFALAGWNPRAAGEEGDAVLACPADLLALL